MADNRTMAQILQAPIEGYEDAIVVPPINANNFELKQPLINLVQSNKFTGRQDPHNHLRFFNKVASTFRHPEVPNTSIKLLLFPFSLDVTNNVNNENANGGNGGNGNGGNNGCSYKRFLACNPRDYDGKGGTVALTRWIEKMESVIENSGCAENQKVKYAASSFVNKALTWWNTQIQARGREAAIGMTWVEFKALLVEAFCPINKMEKLESEFWNHTMVGANNAGYTDRFHELGKLVPHLVTPESKRIRRYINGLAPQIRGMLRATQP
ncbi:reverse transcriptase domain-containing protein, partial [Tanacetum coccineum]